MALLHAPSRLILTFITVRHLLLQRADANFPLLSVSGDLVLLFAFAELPNRWW
jgi:hypothetical protein